MIALIGVALIAALLPPAASAEEPTDVPVATTTSIILTSGVGVVGVTSLFHVQTNPLPPGGTVDLLVDGVEVASGSFPGDTTDMTLAWTPSMAASYAVTARYNGAPGVEASTSEVFAFTAELPTPYVAVTSSNDHPAFGETVTFNATLSPDPGAGTVEWSVDDEVKASVALESGGTSHFSTSFATPHGHSVKARFTGNDSYLPATGNRNVFLYPLGTTMTLLPPSDPIPAGPVTVGAALAPNPGGGTLTWRLNHGDAVQVAVDSDGTTDIALGPLAPGAYSLAVAFSGHGQYADTAGIVAFGVLRVLPIALTSSRTTATQGELPVVLTARLTSGGGWAGTVTFLDDVGGEVVALGPVSVSSLDGTATLSTSSLRVGTHTIHARYNGVPAMVAPSVSDPITVTVLPDTAVHATFKPSSSAFYPYRDGYRDAVSLGGVLDEVASVTVRVYSSTGSLKRTFSLGTRAAGAYSVTWNGRTSGGASVAAGKYTVKASFRDVRGHARTIVGYTTVSWRQVVWKTASTLTRYGDQLSYYATPGGQLFYSDDYSRGRTLFAGEAAPGCAPDCELIYGTTTFSLRSTALAYRYVKATVTGHTFAGYASGSAFFVRWSTGAPAMQPGLPEHAWQPVTFSASPTTNVSPDRRVVFGVWCTQEFGDAFDLHHVKLNYQYAVWKT